MKDTKKDYYLYTIITLTYVAFILINYFVFQKISGSGGDYITQHLPFIEQIRYNFFQTKELFPQLNMNLAMFQSFTMLYYHGMYNPFIVLSFIFPFISTNAWIQIISIMLVMLTAIFSNQLFKRWEISFKLRTILVILASVSTIPAVMSHHLMYVYYIPFLYLNLIAFEKMINDKKNNLYIVSMLAISFTSYYTLVGVYVLQMAYLLILYLKKRVTITKRDISNYLIINIIFVLISMFVIWPQLIEVVTGSTRTANPTMLLYYNYFPYYAAPFILKYNLHLFVTPSLYTVIIVALGWLLWKKDSMAIIPALFLLNKVFAPFNVFLNGFQYASDKIDLIFGPVLMLCVGYVLHKASNKERKIIILISAIMLAIMYGLMVTDGRYVLTSTPSNVLAMFGLYIAFAYYDKLWLDKIWTMTIVSSLIIYFFLAPNIRTIPLEKLEKYQIEGTALAQITPYRVYNTKNYQFDINGFGTSGYTSIQNDNYFQFMNSDFLPQEHTFRSRQLPTSMYIYNVFGIQNNQTSTRPIIYGVAESDVYNEEVLSKLDINEYTLSFLNGVYTTKSTNYDYQPVTMQEASLPTTIELAKGESEWVDVDSIDSERLYLINGYMEPTGCDANCTMTINGESKNQVHENVLNTDYTFIVDIAPGDDLKFESLDESVRLDNISGKYISYEQLANEEFKIYQPTNFTADINDSFAFTIEMASDGIVASTIPYDQGYSVYVDGQIVESYQVSKYFLGFDLPAGKHEIKIEYQIRGFKQAVIMSIAGIVLWVGYGRYYKHQTKEDANE